MSRLNDDETVRRRSGWLIPLSVFGVTFALSAVMLLYYLAPRGDTLFSEQANPTSRSDVVVLRVAKITFRIPANYLVYDSTRTGGDRQEVALFAILPDLTGWSNWAADAFASNAPDSDVVYLTIKARQGLNEADKLKRVWLDYTVDRHGNDGPHGLRQYGFRPDSAYRDEDLFVGQTETGTVVLRCVKPSPGVPSPNCLRDIPLGPSLSLSVRFKRAHLEAWREIAGKTEKLIASFRKPAGK